MTPQAHKIEEELARLTQDPDFADWSVTEVRAEATRRVQAASTEPTPEEIRDKIRSEQTSRNLAAAAEFNRMKQDPTYRRWKDDDLYQEAERRVTAGTTTEAAPLVQPLTMTQIHGQTPQRRKVRTPFHIVLTIATVGMWLPFWIGTVVWTNYANRREAQGRAYMSGGKVVGIGFATYFGLTFLSFGLMAVLVASSDSTIAASTAPDTAASVTSTTKPTKPSPGFTINGVKVSSGAFTTYSAAKNTGNAILAASVAQILTDHTASCADYAEMVRNARNLTDPEAKEHIERALRWSPQADRCG